MNFKNANPVPNVEILIVTYAKDFPWLAYALKCIKRHASGFKGVTVAIPDNQLSELYEHVRGIDLPISIRTYPEPPGKGFFNHEIQMASAEKLVPTGTKFVMHMDADCMMKISNTPEDYFIDDKPIYIWRTWDSLSSPDPGDPEKRIVSDCLMWKEPTRFQMGFESEAYTMTRHPTVFPVDFYPKYRAHVSGVHAMPFEDFMLSGQHNSHPQDRLDFTAQGQYAFHFMRERFHWINCATEEYPADRMKAFHSHSGFPPNVVEEINSFLR